MLGWNRVGRPLAVLAVATVVSLVAATNGDSSEDGEDKMLIEKANVAVFGTDESLNTYIFSLFNILSNISGIDFGKEGEPANIGIYYGEDIFLENNKLDVSKFEITQEHKNLIADLEFENSACSMLGMSGGSFVIAADVKKLGNDSRLWGCVTFAVGIMFGARGSIEGITDYRQMIAETIGHISRRDSGPE